MLFSQSALLSLLLIAPQLSAVQAEACFGTSTFVFNVENGECTADEVLEYLEAKIEDTQGRRNECDNTASQELVALTGQPSLNKAKKAISNICDALFDEKQESAVGMEATIIPKNNQRALEEYFDGGTSANWEIEYITDGGGATNVLKDDFAKINSFYNSAAQQGLVEYPDYLKNFDKCDYRAAYCCWIQDRQANDNNGNCNTPYESKCVDKDPGDNTDLCYVDMSLAPKSAHVRNGYVIFPDDNNDGEGAIHCHGFAWGDDSSASDARYKGNNLFYVSLYDHFYTRGYVRNVPGAPMCGCAEQMPIVSRADCTEMDVAEKFQYRYDGASGGGFSVKVKSIGIEFNACQGVDADGNDDDNDLESYYRRLVEEERADAEELEELQTRLVGDCEDAIAELVDTL